MLTTESGVKVVCLSTVVKYSNWFVFVVGLKTRLPVFTDAVTLSAIASYFTGCYVFRSVEGVVVSSSFEHEFNAKRTTAK